MHNFCLFYYVDWTNDEFCQYNTKYWLANDYPNNICHTFWNTNGFSYKLPILIINSTNILTIGLKPIFPFKLLWLPQDILPIISTTSLHWVWNFSMLHFPYIFVDFLLWCLQLHLVWTKVFEILRRLSGNWKKHFKRFITIAIL